MGGEPTWYSVCPEDPNLPNLPPPIHYKTKGHAAVEHLLNRFKSNFTTLKFKSSRSMMSSLDLSSSDSTLSLPLAVAKRRRSAPRTRLHRIHKSRPGSYGLQYEDTFQAEAEADGSDETKAQMMMKLATILKVLKDSAENDEAQSADDTVLDAIEETTKKNKLQSILQVLRDDTPNSSSESGDNLDDSIDSTDGDHQSSMPVEDGTFSTLDRQVRKRKQQQNSTLGFVKPHSRPKSDSFNMIPNLRSSLSARGTNKVPTFSFFEGMQGSVQLQTQRESSVEELDSMDDDEKSDATFAEHYRLVDENQSDNEQEPPPPEPKGEESNQTSLSGSLPRATTAAKSSRPSDWTCYPAEISLHRISVVDVDREKEEREKGRKVMTLPSPQTNLNKRFLAPSLACTPENNLTKSAKLRSKSLGDMDDLESEEELILVRSPMTPGNELDGMSRDSLECEEVVPFSKVEERVNDDEEDTFMQDEARRGSFAISSLDFLDQPRSPAKEVSLVRVGDKEDNQDGEEKGSKGDGDKNTVSKWRSLDNLLSGSLTRK